MTARTRRLLPLAAIGLAIAACGPSTNSPIPPATADASPLPTVATPVTVDPSASADGSAGTGLTVTDTEWGPIWDGVPQGFPRAPGGASADDATPDPVSDAYVIDGGDATEVATFLQTAMETATYSTESLAGPLEDGSFVLDSVGDTGCRIQTTIAPQGGLLLVTVRYGADCPAS